MTARRADEVSLYVKSNLEKVHGLFVLFLIKTSNNVDLSLTEEGVIFFESTCMTKINDGRLCPEKLR